MRLIFGKSRISPHNRILILCESMQICGACCYSLNKRIFYPFVVYIVQFIITINELFRRYVYQISILVIIRLMAVELPTDNGSTVSSVVTLHLASSSDDLEYHQNQNP